MEAGIFSTVVTFFCSRKIGGTFPNGVCCILICILCWCGFVFPAMASFLCYLFLDMFFRDETMPTEIIIHHVCCAILTLSGMIFIMNSSTSVAQNGLYAASAFLSMEATTPILHAGKYFKDRGLDSMAFISLIGLIIAWIPLRLIHPAKGLIIMYTLSQERMNISIVLVCVASIGLFCMQVWWFLRLCVLMMQSVKKIMIQK